MTVFRFQLGGEIRVTPKNSSVFVVSLLAIASASMFVFLPAFPMVTIPKLCTADESCLGDASLSCIVFGAGGVLWDGHYYLTLDSSCQLPTQYAASSNAPSVNTTMNTNEGDY